MSSLNVKAGSIPGFSHVSSVSRLQNYHVALTYMLNIPAPDISHQPKRDKKARCDFPLRLEPKRFFIGSRYPFCLQAFIIPLQQRKKVSSKHFIARTYKLTDHLLTSSIDTDKKDPLSRPKESV